MVECKYRIPVEKTEKPSDGIEKALSQSVKLETAVYGQFRQTFEHGLCQLLTANDFGPMECQKPNSNHKNCPDIKGLK